MNECSFLGEKGNKRVMDVTKKDTFLGDDTFL